MFLLLSFAGLALVIVFGFFVAVSSLFIGVLLFTLGSFAILMFYHTLIVWWPALLVIGLLVAGYHWFTHHQILMTNSTK